LKEKDLLRTIAIRNLLMEHGDQQSIRGTENTFDETAQEDLRQLQTKGLVSGASDGAPLTSTGRALLKVVFIGGVFEIIHVGHIYTIEQAKKLGDVLVAVVARDNTVRKRKGRDPISPERERLRLVAAIRHVDLAILGSETNIYDTLEKLRPDIVALGYDQYHTEEKIISEAKKRGMDLAVVRLDSPVPSLKTSKIMTEL